ncbi:Uncharacterised protein [Shigella sonnei]|nr:Uncharacterised protein [Shigella sonnei]
MFPSNYCILFFPFHSYKNSLNLCLKNLDYHKHHFLLLLYFLYRQSKNRECDNRLLSLNLQGILYFASLHYHYHLNLSDSWGNIHLASYILVHHILYSR